MKRLNYLDNLKGFGMIMVVMGHISLLPISVNHFIYSFHMPLFFLISGYLYNQKDITIYNEILINFKRYIIPYFKIGLICFFVWGVIIKLIKKEGIEIWDGLFSLVFNTYNKVNCTPIWYLYTLFIAFIIFRFSLRINYIFSILLLIIISFFLSNIKSNYISINSFLAAFYMLVGYRCNFFDFNIKYLIIVIVLILAILLVFFGIPINEFMHNNFKQNFFYCIIFSLIMCLLLVFVFKNYLDFKIKTLSFISKNSIVFFGYNYALNTFTLKYLIAYNINFILGTFINVSILIILAFLINKSRFLSFIMK